MDISPDGNIIRFKTKSKELFEVEKSGAKPNTVKILDVSEADRIRHTPPEKIIIQRQRETFFRTLTDINLDYNVLDKVIAIFSWTNKKHHHPTPNDTEHDPCAHTMGLDDPPREATVNADPHVHTIHAHDEPLEYTANISLPVRKRLDAYRAEKTYDSFISKLVEYYKWSCVRTKSNDSDAVKKLPTAKTMCCPNCDGTLLKSREGEFGKCATCQAIFHLEPEVFDRRRQIQAEGVEDTVDTQKQKREIEERGAPMEKPTMGDL